MTIKEELLELKNEHGLIVPEVVLKWAREHPDSALHASINWDPDHNINGYLLLQVRNIITLNIRTEHRDPQVVSLSIDRSAGEGGGYRQRNEVLAAPDLRAIMLKDALRELVLLRRRYEELTELTVVWQAVAVVEAMIGAPTLPPISGKPVEHVAA